MNNPRVIEPRPSQHLPHFLSRQGCSLVDFKSIEATFNDGVGRKVLFLLDLENANSLVDEGIDNDRLLRLMTDIMAKNTGADYVSLLVYNSISSEWVLQSEHGQAEAAIIEVCQQIMIRDAFEIFKSKKSYLPCTDRMTVNTTDINLVCTPLISKSKVIGGMILVKAGARQFNQYDIMHASIMGQWCSMKMEHIGLLRQMLTQQEYEQKLLSQVCRSQEEERRRVASELHDGVAQWLVSASYDLGACQLLAEEHPGSDIGASLQRVKETLQRCIKELRRTIADLRPLSITELGLIGSLNQSAQSLNREGVACAVTVQEELPKLSLAEETTVFWIVQEALNNIRKHADATRVDIEFSRRGGLFNVRITDNGKGFDAEQVARDSMPLLRLGVNGMKERAKLLGGQLEVLSQPGNGTTVDLTFMVIASLETKVPA